MRQNHFLKGLKIIVMVIVASAAFGFIIQHLWNWLMPAILGLRTVTFWQALGLFVLSKILFGGFHRHGPRGRWGRQIRERFAQMSPEEQEKFRSGMRSWRGCRPHPVSTSGAGQAAI